MCVVWLIDLICWKRSDGPGCGYVKDCYLVVSQVWGLISQKPLSYILLLISQVQSVINT